MHQTLVEQARPAGFSEMDAHIFIELVGIQMLLMSTLEPLLHGETRTADQVANLFPPDPDNQSSQSAGAARRRRNQKEESNIMPAVQHWGRKESIIWPPRGYIYTIGAFCVALMATALLMYVRFERGFTPLQKYYLPYYVRTELAAQLHPADAYQLLYIADRRALRRLALEDDVQPGNHGSGRRPSSAFATGRSERKERVGFPRSRALGAVFQ